MITGCLKPPIHRMGGKHYLTGWLRRYIPGHVCYVEPFAGAAHLLFTKAAPSPVEVLNDIDNHLVNFFQVIQATETRQALVDRLAFMPYSRKLWQEIRTRWKQGAVPGDLVEASAEWFFLNRTCFAGDQARGGFACPSVTGRNPVQSFRNSVETFAAVAERLRNVCIENVDYADCLRRYDSQNTLHYIDPPYLDAGHYYGKENFAYEDHRTLARLLNEAKGMAMVSHYANGLYDELYRGWHRYEYSNFKGSHKSEGEEKPKTIEVLYCNFKPAGQTRSLFLIP